MDGAHGADRSVRVCLACRKVTVELPDGRQAELSYPGLLLTGYEGDRQAYERWVPLGPESSEYAESDDERLVQALAEALRWQHRETGR
jgi:hypothetical protein